MDVVLLEESCQVLAEFLAVQPLIVIAVELCEVLLELLRECSVVGIKFPELIESNLQFVVLEICWIDHPFCLLIYLRLKHIILICVLMGFRII